MHSTEVQNQVTQKLDKISKIQPNQIWILSPSTNHLPAAIVNGGGYILKIKEFLSLKVS